MVLESEEDHILHLRTRKLLNVFQNELDCEIIEESDIGLGLCLNTLPLNYIPKADYSSQRYIRILRSDIVNFVPIFDSFKGLSEPLQIYLSRENNLIGFSLFENPISSHTVILSDSGSGKSSFVVDVIQSIKKRTPEPLCFIVDKKSSYKMLSNYFDSDLTIFGKDGEIPFSPFRGHYDEQKFTFLTHLIIAAIKLTSESFQIESEHIAAITKALKIAHRRKAHEAGLDYIDGELVTDSEKQKVEISMEDAVAALASLTSLEEFEKQEDLIEKLIHKLSPFHGDGLYSPYFSNFQKTKDSKDCLLYIYDLDALDNDPTLQTLMTLSVFEEIRRVISLPENRNRGGLVIIEELGMLGRNNPTANRFIIDFAETFRKLGYWLIGLTPRPQNYFELEAGKALWGVSDNFIFLKMSPDNVEYLAKKSSILDEANKEIIKSLQTIKGKYADIYYCNKDKSKQGAFRNFQTPYDRWLAPTNMKDARRANKAIKKFGEDKWEALEYLKKTYL